MWNSNDISYARFGIRSRRGFFLYLALKGRRFKRTHTSMWCINETYQKIWGRICYTKTTRPQLMQTNNFNPAGSDFFMLNRLGAGPLYCPTPLLHNDQEKNQLLLLHNDQEKNQLLLFISFCLKRWRPGIVDPIWLKKFTKVNADQICWATIQSFWNNQFVDNVKMHYNIFLTFSDKTRWSITLLYHMALYACLIFVNIKKNCRRKLSFYFCNNKRDHSVLSCFIVCIG